MEPVYSSSEDSWLLAECIKKENLCGKKCLDLGCGSGIQGIAMLKAGANEVLAADVNESALKLTNFNVMKFTSNAKNYAPQILGHSKTQSGFTCPSEVFFAGPVEQAQLGPAKLLALLGHFLGVRKSDLFSNIKEKFDFIAFNPPYVPSDDVKWRDLDGGKEGREVIDRFIVDAQKHLNKKGVLLLLLSSLNNPSEVASLLKKRGFVVEVVGKKKLFFEELVVLRAGLV